MNQEMADALVANGTPLRVEFYNALQTGIDPAANVLLRELKSNDPRASEHGVVSKTQKITELKETIGAHRADQVERAFARAADTLDKHIDIAAGLIVSAYEGFTPEGGEVSRVEKMSQLLVKMESTADTGSDFWSWSVSAAKLQLGFGQ